MKIAIKPLEFPLCVKEKLLKILKISKLHIRYILPKGTFFASLTQDDCYLIASHINSTPRLSLNNHSPYDSIQLFLGEINLKKLHIKKIDYDDTDLSYRLLRK